MSESGAELLRREHGVSDEQIDLIPHGIPSVPAEGHKDRLGVEGRTVILTFGLLSRDKGIEYVIDALPAILAVRPDTVYIVLGATHPHVVEREGEAYRLMLEARGEQLGVGANLIFHNRFVSQEELTEFLAAADIYITPYLQPEQITSGTLAYAAGAGKAVISTPYIYARELLADGRGKLVPYRDSDAIAREVLSIMGDDEGRETMKTRAAAYGAHMTWPAVAKQYVASFERARSEHRARRDSAFQTRTRAARPLALPEVDLRHVRAMTDDTGMLQHAAFNMPRYEEGYCVDDNARALLLMTLLEDAGPDEPAVVRALAARYLAFVRYAFDRPAGRFRNFLSYGRQWVEPHGSEDSHGRALWSLGAVVGRANEPGRQSLAGDLFHAALPALSRFSSPRAWAYGLLGIDEYLHAFRGDTAVESVRADLAERLLELYARTSRHDWPWFEDSVTYCNARLPQALLLSGTRMHRRDMIDASLRSLEWLVTVQTSVDGHFAAIGSNGFYQRGAIPAAFDQQPVEASATACACLEAHRLTGDARWAERGKRAFDWFLGQNQGHRWLYDASTGGCRDGLHPDRANENQGAEATLSFLLTLHEMRQSDSRTASGAATLAIETHA